MPQNCSLDSPNSGVRSSRVAIKDELVGKLVFDDARVFNRLALGSISDQFVTSCAQAFATDHNLLDARRALDQITRAAISKLIELLEVDDMVYDASEEKKMYKPLKSVFQHIENFHNPSEFSTLKRSFEPTDKSGSNSLKAVPILESSSAFPQLQLHLDRNTQGPISSNPKAVKPIVYQALNNARLYLSTRPFQLYLIGLLIFGSRFCVAIFDRDGVVFSPVHDMWGDIEIFIRVVRSLTCRLSSVELGHDPMVTALPNPQHDIWRNQTKDLGREAPTDFPTSVITTKGSRSPSWYTIRFPLWTSVSLPGRGTSIWLVQEDSTGPALALKNTWASTSWTSESMIYGSINGDHHIPAKFSQEKDVLFPQEQRSSNLRSSRIGEKNERVFFSHRLLLKSCGRPLCEYRSEKELLQGIRAALRVHELLCDQGILHRDISTSNIMLSVETTPDAGAEGFLMDLEFARLKQSPFNVTTTTTVPLLHMPDGGTTSPTIGPQIIFGPDVIYGAATTGTAQFMAEEILGAILTKKRIVHEPRHDVESFVHVLAYSVARRAVLESQSLHEDMRRKLLSFFQSIFGQMDFFDIWISKRGQNPLIFGTCFPGLVSAPMSELFETLEDQLLQSRLSLKRSHKLPLTHAYVLSVLDEAIEKMV